VIVYFAALHVHALRRVIETLGPQPNGGVLLSFFGDSERLADAVFARQHGWKVFLDSGAFSAMRRKKPVNLADYAAFLRDHGNLFDRRASLDVIGNPIASAANFKKLQKFDVLPVFHVGSPTKFLDPILAENVPFALGGMVGIKGHELLAWQARTWRAIEKHGTHAVHGFGVTGTRTLAAFPWDSCDSTTPTAVGNRGLIPRWSKSGTPSFMNPAGFTKGALARQLHVTRAFRGAHPGAMFETDAHRSQLLVETARMILTFAARIDAHRAAQRRSA
jgi:hypothetical protein